MDLRPGLRDKHGPAARPGPTRSVVIAAAANARTRAPGLSATDDRYVHHCARAWAFTTRRVLSCGIAIVWHSSLQTSPASPLRSRCWECPELGSSRPGQRRCPCDAYRSDSGRSSEKECRTTSAYRKAWIQRPPHVRVDLMARAQIGKKRWEEGDEVWIPVADVRRFDPGFEPTHRRISKDRQARRSDRRRRVASRDAEDLERRCPGPRRRSRHDAERSYFLAEVSASRKGLGLPDRRLGDRTYRSEPARRVAED